MFYSRKRGERPGGIDSFAALKKGAVLKEDLVVELLPFLGEDSPLPLSCGAGIGNWLRVYYYNH